MPKFVDDSCVSDFYSVPVRNEIFGYKNVWMNATHPSWAMMNGLVVHTWEIVTATEQL